MLPGNVLLVFCERRVDPKKPSKNDKDPLKRKQEVLNKGFLIHHQIY
jgi:hypothetical protein